MSEWALANTILIAIDFLVIAYGIYLITVRRDRVRHQRTMITAGVIFLVFLASFVARLLHEGLAALPTWEASPLGIQPVHILLVHEIIAVVTVALVGTTYWLAYKKDFRRHRRVAPWAAGFWLFQSAFGIFDYFMIHVW